MEDRESHKQCECHETQRERTKRQEELGRPHHLPGSEGYFWNAEHWVLTHSNCRTTGWKGRSDWHGDKSSCDVGTGLSHTVMLPMLTGGETIPISLTNSHQATLSPRAKWMKRKSPYRASFTSCCWSKVLLSYNSWMVDGKTKAQFCMIMRNNKMLNIDYYHDYYCNDS